MLAVVLRSRALLQSSMSRRQLPRAAFTTYSGGHASEGQGGFYGSLKSRSEGTAKFTPGYRAEEADIRHLQTLMQQANSASFAQVVADESTQQLIDRLYFKGSPVWGLSLKEREFVSTLRMTPLP
ncbi:hypothetical protein H257_10713 [Aphanomyces astaci]|uniref:Uncharacterized protein n=1 Tax=Aphanomyces astaci TaxID=112090 RepID=W4G6B0_APHAT|nr:hypothetical protein H257_10713 [Aphanomyces astaci]ETV74564.1 hypothetical protein H257_10713 [Aphanomyces astaci]RQM29151.1 hypothetical protein B5M09_009236 [Aphanomyces astaci]|eukprot:XP_009835651.1 hypothetical protein H257_10713 [Aphanomyces astaci]